MEKALLEWFEEHGRDLPWRRTRDPYAILVSEVMLQQTQVARVIPRYLAFLERWPTVEALAAASPADVIREWQGLGYNRRALSLHQAATRIAAEGWPDDLTELPGVGRYTADAVARFALEQPVLPVDTNVSRVLERTRGEFGPASAHALMDLGATVCLARIPRCGACPLSARMPLPRQALPGAAEAKPVRGLVPPAARPHSQPRGQAASPTQFPGREATESLAADGLVEVRQGLVSLPDSS